MSVTLLEDCIEIIQEECCFKTQGQFLRARHLMLVFTNF
jgi:hypothetical protein